MRRCFKIQQLIRRYNLISNLYQRNQKRCKGGKLHIKYMRQLIDRMIFQQFFNIGIQVSQLCESILIFQRHMSTVKQQLLLINQVSDTLIWNHIVGDDLNILTKQILIAYFNKNNVKYNNQTIDLLMYQYSTTKHNYLTRQQFISIFVDNSQKCIYQIFNSRNNKYSYAKNYIPHYKITDYLIQILIQTLQFLSVKQSMKRNIFIKKQQLKFHIDQVDSKHFLVFINQFKPNWLLEECQIVLKHIIKFKQYNLKQFYFFFVPFNCQSKQLNPNKNILNKIQTLQLKQTYASITDHKKASHFGNKPQKFRKTLYLK